MEAEARSWAAKLEIAPPSLRLTDMLTDKNKPADRKKLTYWRSLMMGCLPNPKLDSIIRTSRLNCFCFCGPHGVGKHRLALSYAGTASECGMRFLYATGEMLRQSTSDQTRQRVLELFLEAMAKPTVLLLERLTANDEREDVWNNVVQACADCKPKLPLTVIVIESDESAVREEWKRALLYCQFDLPNQEEREVFFEYSENNMPRHKLSENVSEPSFSWLASETEGLNYVQLKTVVQMVRMQMKARAMELYQGDAKLTMEAYQQGRFYYTEELFRDTVKIVRRKPQEDTPAAPPIQVTLNGIAPAASEPALVEEKAPVKKPTEKMTMGEKISVLGLEI